MARPNVSVLIELDINKAQKSIRELSNKLKGIGEEKITLDFDANFKGLKKQERLLRQELKLFDVQISKIKNSLKNMDSNGSLHDFWNGQFISKSQANSQLEQLKKQRAKIQQALKGIQVQVDVTPHVDLRKAYNIGKSIQGAIGTSLETIGNGLSSLANNPINEIFTGMLRTLGYNFTNAMSEGLSNAVSRYDTMKTYPKLMAEFGFSTEESTASIEELNEAVLGLPTSLDTIVSRAKTFSSILGDIDLGTDLAIATNNAFLASSSTDEQVNQGEQQLRNLISGGTLTTKQWQSLYRSMPVALAQVGKDMGYKTSESFYQALVSNQISNDELVDALIESGTGSGALTKMADVSKSTMQGVITNISAAFSRMGEGIFTALDTALMGATGKSLVGNLNDVIDVIDSYSAKLQTWVKNNPELIKEWIDRIKSFDLEGFLKGFAEGLTSGISALTKLLSLLPADMTGKILGGAGIFGRITTTVGQFVKGLSPIGGIISMIVKAKLVGKSVSGGGSFGFLDKLKGFFTKTGTAMQSVSKVPATGAATKAMGNIKSFFMGLAKIAGIAGIAVVIGGSITALVKLAEIVGNADINWSNAAKNAGIISLFIVALGVIGAAISRIAGIMVAAIEGIALLGTFTTLIAGFIAVDAWLLKKAMQSIKSIFQAVSDTAEIIDDMERPDSSSLDVLDDVISFMSDAYKKLDDFIDAGIFDTSGGIKKGEAKGINKVVKAFKSTVESLSTIVQTFVEMIENAETLQKKAKNGTSNYTKVSETIDSIIETIKDVYKQLDDYFDLSWLDDGDINASDTEELDAIVEQFTSTIDSISTIVETMNGMVEDVNELQSVKKARVVNSKNYGATTVLDQLESDMEDIISAVKKFYDKIDEWIKTGYLNVETSKNVATILSQLSKMIGSVQDIVGAFNDLDTGDLFSRKSGGLAKIDIIADRIKTVIQKVKGLYDEIKNSFNFAGNGSWTASTAKNIAKIFAQLKDAIASISEIITLFDTLESKLKSSVLGDGLLDEETLEMLPTSPGSDGKDTSATAETSALFERLGNVIENLKTIMGKLQTMNTGDLPDMTAVKDVITGFGDVITAYNNLPDVEENTKGDGTYTAEHVAEKVGNLITHLNEIKNEFDKLEDASDEDEGGIETTMNTVKAAVEAFNGVMTAYNELPEVAENTKGDGVYTAEHVAKKVGNLITNLNKIEDASETEANMNTVKAAVEAFGKAITAYNELPLESEEETAANEAFGAMPVDITGSVSSPQQAARSIKALVEAMKLIPSGENLEANLVLIESAINEFGAVIDAFTGVADKITGFDWQTPMGQLALFITQLKTTIGVGSGKSSGLGANSIGKIASATSGSSLGDFATSLDELSTAIENFVGTDGLESIVQALKDIATEVSTTQQKLIAFLNIMANKFRQAGRNWRIGLLSGLQLSSLATQISSALSSAFSSRNFYQSGYSTGSSFANGLSVGISRVSSTIGSNISSIASSAVSIIKSVKGKAHGGLITPRYYATGGIAVMRPRGTDRIPAMLSLGEFVQRKKAVNHFGTRFMERINALDLDGALRSLSYRASGIAKQGGTTIINYNTNNNQKVTQHINTNNSGYAFRKADRYVRSL